MIVDAKSTKFRSGPAKPPLSALATHLDQETFKRKEFSFLLCACSRQTRFAQRSSYVIQAYAHDNTSSNAK